MAWLGEFKARLRITNLHSDAVWDAYRVANPQHDARVASPLETPTPNSWSPELDKLRDKRTPDERIFDALQQSGILPDGVERTPENITGATREFRQRYR